VDFGLLQRYRDRCRLQGVSDETDYLKRQYRQWGSRSHGRSSGQRIRMCFRNRGRASRRRRPRKEEFQLKSEGGEPLLQLNQRLRISLCKGPPSLVLPHHFAWERKQNRLSKSCVQYSLLLNTGRCTKLKI